MPKACALVIVLLSLFTPACQSAPEEQPPSEAQTRVVRLEHAEATEMSATLQELLTHAAVAGGSVACEVHANAATNSLLITGNDEQLSQVMNLVSRLDVPVGP